MRAVGLFVSLPVSAAVLGATGGAAIGLAQWLVLRRWVARAALWMFASTLGYSLATFAGALGIIKESESVLVGADEGVGRRAMNGPDRFNWAGASPAQVLLVRTLSPQI